jgi:4'-phosphopantetheinyl transferase
MNIRKSNTEASSIETWALPPDWPSIETNEVQVWHVDLSVSSRLLSTLRGLLSLQEQERANRFHFAIHRERFTVARACLRMIIGRYLRTDPCAIEFRFGEYGKPELTHNPLPLKFNLAHCENLALYAFTRDREIGIDLERVTTKLEIEEIATRFFSRREVQVLRRLPDHMKPRAFFNCWTRKEAVIKAIGNGLSLPLDQFDVTLAPLTPAVLLRTRFDEAEASRWSLHSIDPGEEYAATIAVEGTDWQLSCYRLTEDLLCSYAT